MRVLCLVGYITCPPFSLLAGGSVVRAGLCCVASLRVDGQGKCSSNWQGVERSRRVVVLLHRRCNVARRGSCVDLAVVLMEESDCC